MLGRTSSLAFHRKSPLWKSIRGYMIGQQGRGVSGCHVGLSGYEIDHHGLLFPSCPCAPANVVFFCPSPLLSLHQWPETLVYLTPLPLEIVLGSYVISLKSFNIIVMYCSYIKIMSCFYLFVFLFLFCIFICINFTNLKA